MKLKKLYSGAVFRNLKHEVAKCKCLINPEFVMTRHEWVGYHFIRDGEYYILTKDNEVLHIGNAVFDDISEKIYNVEDSDWIITFRSKKAKQIEDKYFENLAE